MVNPGGQESMSGGKWRKMENQNENKNENGKISVIKRKENNFV